MKNFRSLPLVTLAILSFAAAAHAAEYRLSKTIPVGGDGGWDCLSVDSAAHRLYVSHATRVVVIDTDAEKVVGEITNTLGVHGIAVAPELNRAFVSCGKENKVAVVDLQTLQTLSKIGAGKNPDIIIYEPKRQEVYCFNGKSQDATVIDAKSGQVVATVPLGGKPEFARADSAAGRVFVNVEDKNEIAAIDTATHAVVAHWPIAPGESASGLGFDAQNHRLFAACDNKLMVMLDGTTGKVLASVPIGDSVDGCEFDAASQLAFAPCGEGAATIAHADGDKLTTVQTLKTARGARTMTVDPATHKIYLPAADYPAGTEGERRPKMIPGSFRILVFSPTK